MIYFNHANQVYPAKSNVANKAIDISISANEVSIGTVKVSGFSPLWKVNIETPYANGTVAATAKTFAIKSTIIKLKKLGKENTPFIRGERNAKTTNVTIEPIQALTIVLA